ncbi:hypothetical protein BTUL_0030g00040 [Botrytis tulipae]|uniref:Uncharacterized protein n=1 Tax=Botrytis tulipae TaxID=87230 RepID=A0A4Z1F415_9HELO|nr:hypothetical protein BTUL_0030g00040 [Botrytis tulipae]
MSSAASRTNSRIGSQADSKIKAIHTYSYPETSDPRIERTESHKPIHAGSFHPRIERTESHKSRRVGSTRGETERRRSIERPELETQDLNIGGRESPQPSLSPGDTVKSSVDTKIRDIEKHQAALEKFGKHNEGQDSEAGDGHSHRSRRRRRSRSHEKPIQIKVQYEEIGKQRSRSPPDEIVTTTRTTIPGLPFLKKKEVKITQFKKSRSHEDEDHKKPSGSDRIPTDTDRGSDRNRRDEGSDRNTKHSSRKGSVSSREKSERKPESATSSRHGAPTHRSARDNNEQAPRAVSRHSSNSSNSQNRHKVFDDEPSPGGPKALSEGPASGSLDGGPPRSNTGASDRHSLSGRDLKNKYQPNRGPPSNHEQKEHTQISYGRNDKDNEPYAREIGKRDHKSSGSKSSKAGTPTPPGSTRSKAITPNPPESINSKAGTPNPPDYERTQIFRGRDDKEDTSSAYKIERDQSNMSALGSDTSGVRRASTRNSIVAPSHYTASEQASSIRGGEDASSAYEDRTKQSEISSGSGKSRGTRPHR